jgi:hypothetical protein
MEAHVARAHPNGSRLDNPGDLLRSDKGDAHVGDSLEVVVETARRKGCGIEGEPLSHMALHRGRVGTAPHERSLHDYGQPARGGPIDLVGDDSGAGRNYQMGLILAPAAAVPKQYVRGAGSYVDGEKPHGEVGSPTWSSISGNMYPPEAIRSRLAASLSPTATTKSPAC